MLVARDNGFESSEQEPQPSHTKTSLLIMHQPKGNDDLLEIEVFLQRVRATFARSISLWLCQNPNPMA